MLAAGLSTRFGSHKIMHLMADGRPLILHSLEPFQQINLPVTVVCNQQHQDLHLLLRQHQIHYVIAEDACKGMGHSLAQAIQQCPSEHGWLITLADMPYLTSDCITSLLPRCQEKIVRPQYNGQPGHPVYFPHSFESQLTHLKGDLGARQILKHSPPLLIPQPESGCLLDIDSPQDLQH